MTSFTPDEVRILFDVISAASETLTCSNFAHLCIGHTSTTPRASTASPRIDPKRRTDAHHSDPFSDLGEKPDALQAAVLKKIRPKLRKPRRKRPSTKYSVRRS